MLKLLDIVFWTAIIILAIWIIFIRQDLILVGIALILILIFLKQKLNKLDFIEQAVRRKIGR